MQLHCKAYLSHLHLIYSSQHPPCHLFGWETFRRGASHGGRGRYTTPPSAALVWAALSPSSRSQTSQLIIDVGFKITWVFRKGKFRGSFLLWNYGEIHWTAQFFLEQNKLLLSPRDNNILMLCLYGSSAWHKPIHLYPSSLSPTHRVPMLLTRFCVHTSMWQTQQCMS